MINFIRIIDRLFDYFKVKNPYENDLKRLERLINKNVDEIILYESFSYLSTLKIGGVSILTHPRKKIVLEFLSGMSSLKIFS